MSKHRQILAVVERDNSPHAVIERAIWLAERYDCGIELLTCDSDAADSDLVNEARQRDIDACVVQLRDESLDEGVLREVSRIGPRFVLKATRYHSAAERAMFVGADWRLIRKCPAPLWLVKEAAFTDQPIVLAAVDPGHRHDKPAQLDRRIIDMAKSIAQLGNGEVHVVHTYQPVADIGTAATRTFKPEKLSVHDLEEESRATHFELLSSLAKANQIEQGSTHLLAGATRDVLPSYARSENVALIVIGAVSRSKPKQWVIGSTAEQLLDHLPCDVLIVKPSNTIAAVPNT